MAVSLSPTSAHAHKKSPFFPHFPTPAPPLPATSFATHKRHKPPHPFPFPFPFSFSPPPPPPHTPSPFLSSYLLRSFPPPRSTGWSRGGGGQGLESGSARRCSRKNSPALYEDRTRGPAAQ